MLWSCATSGIQIRAITSEKIPEKRIENVFYLIGDTGENKTNKAYKSGLELFEVHYRDSGVKDSYLIFLGDNLGNQKDLTALAGIYNGNPIFIPGHKDWLSGLKGLSDIGNSVNQIFNSNAYFPKNGCPLVSRSISDKIQLLIIDSQWYLENWNDHPNINDDCEIKTRDRFFEVLEAEVRASENKLVLIAMHHPMYTNGIRGGYYSFQDHIFPFQNSIPLPGFGSVVAQFRSQGGVSIQDRYNEKYNQLMKRIKTIVYNQDKVVFLSGHEHNLQYIKSGNTKQVVSGSGAVATDVALGLNGTFCYGGMGFSELIVFEDGSCWVRFYGEKNGKPHMLFETKVVDADQAYDLSLLKNTFKQTKETQLYTTKETEKSEIYKSMWGEFYREAYGKSMELPVVKLDTFHGGVDVLRKGDDPLYRSVIVKSNSGDYYVIKAAKKNPTQYLQNLFFKDSYVENDLKETVIEELLNDLYTASYPQANGVVNTFLKTLQVNYQESEFVYLPKQLRLGNYNAFLGNEVCVIEPLPYYNNNSQSKSNKQEIISSDQIIELLRTGMTHHVDETMYVNARLIDILVGDWSRDKNNWYWKRIPIENSFKYEPIPINRDHAFSKFDGSIFDFARAISEPMNQLQDYNKPLTKKSIKWLTHSAIQLDRLFVKTNNEHLWKDQAKFIQNQVSDNVIDHAFEMYPINASAEYVDQIKIALKNRRDQLVEITSTYLEILNKLVVLEGSDHKDFVEVYRRKNGETQVLLYQMNNNDEKQLVLDRVFNQNVTKEIWIYMLDGDDVLDVQGAEKSKIKIRIIGGQGLDSFEVVNGKNIVIYDNKKVNKKSKIRSKAKIKYTNDYELNVFDYKRKIATTNALLPSFGYNPDDGFLMGISNTYTIKGFERAPFTQRHQIKGGYYFATKGFDLQYNGDFANLIGNWNFSINGLLTSESFSYNYFGLGNETENIDNQKGFNYNRVRMAFQSIAFGVYKKGHLGDTFGVKLAFEGVNVRDTPGRYITEFPPRDDPSVFNQKYFSAIGLNYNYQSLDDYIVPTRGMNFNVDLNGTTNLEDIESSFLSFDTNLVFYNALTRNRRLVLKTVLNSGIRTGNSYMFYQAAHLGGKTGLRGYRAQRFSGSKSLVSNIDFRYSFNNFKTRLIPLKFGLFMGYDFGRVWYNNEVSKVWHDSYGGGFWVSSLDMMSANFNLFGSGEGLRFSFGFNFKM